MAEDGQGDPRRLGEFIRVQRQMADLSLRRLADMTEVSNAYLSQVERGLHRPSLRVLQSIARALDVSADVMLAQAGVEARPGADTETAIRTDPLLTPEDRETLLRVYRSLRKDPAAGQ